MDTTMLIGAVLTVLTSSLMAGVVTFRLNAARDDRLFRRQRLEELHEAFFEVARRLAGYWTPFFAAMGGTITYAQATEIARSEGDPGPLPLARMQMLAALYHLDYLPLVDELLGIQEEANGVIHLHRERYSNGTARKAMKGLSDRLGDVQRRFTSKLRGSK